ncbi:MAG: FtsQ-type POTRA domain-containing protein [Akkermansiaceae bacterium]|nr:FtsQ-type POTRA domain-containing protein [Akkermansiaceae bacterium]
MAGSRTRRKTTAIQRNTRQGGDLQRLHIKVSSPRIVMYQVMRGMNKGVKCFLCLLLVSLALFGGFQGVKSLFLGNEKYQIQEIKLDTNGALDHARVVDLADLDLRATLFAVDTDDVRSRLSALPEVVHCKVERRLPGTLKITIEERVPFAWLECEKIGFLRTKDSQGKVVDGVLVDENGITFPCVGAMFLTSKNLPVIKLREARVENFEHGMKADHVDLMRALHLIKVCKNSDVREQWLPAHITLLNDYSMELLCNNGSEAIFGMYDHERQVKDFITIQEHCLAANIKNGVDVEKHKIKRMNLIPRINIPVVFKKQTAQLNTPILIKPLTSTNP